MGKTENEGNEQLSLAENQNKKTRFRGGERGQREGRVNKKWLVIILILTVIVSLGFYFFSGKEVKREIKPKLKVTDRINEQTEGGMFGSKVYEF